jgi:hypothetical protein
MVSTLIFESFGSRRLRRTLIFPIFDTDNMPPCNLKPVLLNEKESKRSLLLKRGNPGFSPLLQRRKNALKALSNFLMTFYKT